MLMLKFTFILIQQKWQKEKLKLWEKTVIQVSWKCWNTEFPLKLSNVAHYRRLCGTTASSRRTCSWARSPCPWRRWTWGRGRRGGTAWASSTDDSEVAGQWIYIKLNNRSVIAIKHSVIKYTFVFCLFIVNIKYFSAFIVFVFVQPVNEL